MHPTIVSEAFKDLLLFRLYRLTLVADLLPQVQAIHRSILSGLTNSEGAQFHFSLERLQASARVLHAQMSGAWPKTHRHLGQKGKAIP
jgi:hypothetical protein